MFNPAYANNYSSNDIEGIFKSKFKQYTLTDEDERKLIPLFKRVEEENFNSLKDYNKFMLNVGRRQLRIPMYSKAQLRKAYKTLVDKNLIKSNNSYLKFLKNKLPRGYSGVNVVTIFTSGDQMGSSDDPKEQEAIKRGGCPMDCFYCPYEKN